MNLYKKYSYSVEFCAFRKLIFECLSDYINEHKVQDNDFLYISPYLEVSIVHSPQDCQKHNIYAVKKMVCSKSGQNLEVKYDVIDVLAYQYIIKPSNEPQTKWDVLNKRMMSDYERGLFKDLSLEPYFLWKKGDLECSKITKEKIWEMKSNVSGQLEFYDNKHPKAMKVMDKFIVDDPWQFTRGYNEDKYIVAYLNYIENQLDDLFSIC